MAVADGTRAERFAAYDRVASGEARLLATGYDVWRLREDRKRLAGLLGPRCLVIVDESHHLKNPKTQRYRNLRELWEKGAGGPVGWRLLMTGSPAGDKPQDVYGPIELLGLRTWNRWTEFRDRYFDSYEMRIRGQSITKLGDLKKGMATELWGVLHNVGFIRSEAEIGLVLPPLRRDTFWVLSSPAERRAYTVMKDHIRSAADEGSEDNVLAMMTMERLLSSDPELLQRSGSKTSLEIIHDPSYLGRMSWGGGPSTTRCGIGWRTSWGRKVGRSSTWNLTSERHQS